MAYRQMPPPGAAVPSIYRTARGAIIEQLAGHPRYRVGYAKPHAAFGGMGTPHLPLNPRLPIPPAVGPLLGGALATIPPIPPTRDAGFLPEPGQAAWGLVPTAATGVPQPLDPGFSPPPMSPLLMALLALLAGQSGPSLPQNPYL